MTTPRLNDHGVLIHGCHLEANGWEEIAMGNPTTGSLGRIQQGVMRAWSVQARLLYWGTGASQKEGKRESRYTFDTALENWHKLARLCDADDGDPYESPFFRWLNDVSFIDEETQNTDQEFSNFADMCLERGITQVTVISSPFHAPRCLLTAAKRFEHANDPRLQALGRNTMAMFSETNPAGMRTSDTVVVEQPHRGDNATEDFGPTVKRLFQFLRDPDLAAQLNMSLNRTIDKFELELEKAH